MKPNPNYITIDNNEDKIIQLLDELVLTPRLKALKWSKITKQTPNIKIGYPGQHLASLITGVEGTRTGARGEDLIDGTEVKSCSRVDQLDTCKNKSCGKKILRIERKCPHCGSTDIDRKKDSKWLFPIKSDSELKLLTQDTDRIFLTLADYPCFSENNFDIIRFQAFEIWNNTERHKYFTDLMTNYYEKIFLEHIKLNPNKTPAPKNFWPYSYQFYLCNPIKVFECIVKKANTNHEIQITKYIRPSKNRAELIPELMPTSLLYPKEREILINNSTKKELAPLIQEGRTYTELKEALNKTRKEFVEILPFLNEQIKLKLDLRDTDKMFSTKTTK